MRERVAANYRQLEKIVTSPRFRKIGGLRGDTMTRVPRGFAKGHPAAAYLKHRQFMGFREEAAAFATQKNFYVQLRDTFETIVPLVRYLNEPLVASLTTERRAHVFEED